MADNYETTSITLHFTGDELALGPIGNAIISCLFNEGWFEAKDGLGAYDYDSSGINIFESLVETFELPEDLEVTHLSEVLAAVKEARPELVSDKMMKAAEVWWTEGVDEIVSGEAVLSVLLEEPGTNLIAFTKESGWSCSKRRHGEFGGHGYFEGNHAVMSAGSHEAGHAGWKLDAALSKGDVEAAAKVLQEDVLKRQVTIVSPEMRTQVMHRLGELLQQPEASTPPTADA